MKVRIEIHTENVAGDEELIEALRQIVEKYEDEGDVEGTFVTSDTSDEDVLVSWAINPVKTEIRNLEQTRG